MAICRALFTASTELRECLKWFPSVYGDCRSEIEEIIRLSDRLRDRLEDVVVEPPFDFDWERPADDDEGECECGVIHQEVEQ
jgi:hypothetical protein